MTFYLRQMIFADDKKINMFCKIFLLIKCKFVVNENLFTFCSNAEKNQRGFSLIKKGPFMICS